MNKEVEPQTRLNTVSLFIQAFKMMLNLLPQALVIFFTVFVIEILYFVFNPLPQNLHNMSTQQLVMTMLFALLSILFYSSSIHAAGQLAQGKSVNLFRSMWRVICLYPILFVSSLIVSTVTATGILFFILPGIVFAMLFSTYVPHIVLDSKGVFSSIIASSRLVIRHFFHVLVTFAGLFIIGMIVNIILYFLGIHVRSSFGFIILAIAYFFYVYLFIPCVIGGLFVELKKV